MRRDNREEDNIYYNIENRDRATRIGRIMEENRGNEGSNVDL